MAYNQIPALVTPAENLSNPTLIEPQVCFPMAYDGSTWDRLRTNDHFLNQFASPDVGILAVLNPDRRYSAGTLTATIGNTLVWACGGGDSVMLVCQTTTTGTYLVEVTYDGTNWVPAEVRRTSTDEWQSGKNQTPTSGAVYRVLTIGAWSVRVRTISTLGATVTFVATIAARQPFVMGMKTGPAPHSVGYAIVHKDAEYTTAQTGVALWTPASGNKFVVTRMTITVGGIQGGTVTVWQGASGDTTYSAGTDPAIFRGEFAPSATSKPGTQMLGFVYQSTTADHILRVTTSAAMTVYIQLEGYEI
jgi:hypothetical protein